MLSDEIEVVTTRVESKKSKQLRLLEEELSRQKAKLKTLTRKASFYHLIRAGDFRAVKHRLFHGEDVNKQGLLTWTPLHVAAYYGRYNILKFLIRKGSKLDAAISLHCKTFGWTPLHFAVKMNHIRCVRYLLKRRANVNANKPWQPLLVAVLKNRVEIAALLLEYGADINFEKDMHRGVPYEIIAKPILHHVIENQFFDMAFLLLKNGIDIRKITDLHETVLMFAVAANNLELVEYFLANGADPNYRDAYGKPVIYYLVLNRNTAVSKYCKQEFALVRRKRDILRLLAEAKADVNAMFFQIDTRHPSFLYCAAEHGYAPLVKLLLFECDLRLHNIALDVISNVAMRTRDITPDLRGDDDYLGIVANQMRKCVALMIESVMSRYMFGLLSCEKILQPLMAGTPISLLFNAAEQKNLIRILIGEYLTMFKNMKVKKIGRSGFTYWELATCGIEKLIKLTKNKEITDVYLHWCKYNYYAYSFFIMKRVEFGTELKLRIETAIEALFTFFQDQLPYDCCERIACFFDYEELKSVILSLKLARTEIPF